MHTESWDLSSSSLLSQGYFWVSRRLLSANEASKDTIDFVKGNMSGLSQKQENMEISPDPSGDPTKKLVTEIFMEDLYKDDPNSWLRRTKFSRTVYHRQDFSQVPISVFTKPTLGSSHPKLNQTAISIPVDQSNTFKTNTDGISSLPPAKQTSLKDLYKDDPNSWLRRTYFSNTVYRRPILSQNANQAAISIPVSGDQTSRTSQLITNPSLKQNPHSRSTGEEHGNGGSDSKTNNTARTSKHWAISDMLKEAKRTVRKQFVAPPSKERTGATTAMSSSKSKKKSRWVRKYFGRGVRQVSALEKSSEVR